MEVYVRFLPPDIQDYFSRTCFPESGTDIARLKSMIPSTRGSCALHPGRNAGKRSAFRFRLVESGSRVLLKSEGFCASDWVLVIAPIRAGTRIIASLEFLFNVLLSNNQPFNLLIFPLPLQFSRPSWASGRWGCLNFYRQRKRGLRLTNHDMAHGELFDWHIDLRR